MAIVGRLAGGILAKSENDFYLVGNLKEPCDFPAAGFVDPGEINPLERPFIKLEVSGNPRIKTPIMNLDLEGEELADVLSKRLVIKRNGSVSERLWDLIFDAEEYGGRQEIDAAWLGRIPEGVWEIVREEILSCR